MRERSERTIQRSRWKLALAVATVAGLSACGPSQLGAAAVVNSQRITVSDVQGRLKAVQALQDRYGVEHADPSVAARNEVQRWVVALVFERAARDLGINITDGEVSNAIDAETKLVGGPEQFRAALAQADLSENDVNDVFRQQVINSKIGSAVLGQAGTKLTQDQVDAKVHDTLVATAKRLHIRINPRYGTFDGNMGQISPPAPDFLRPTG
ncbi:MAG TPA: SurA N-terminal domain-containing protein [Sporichthyaceae bacterium]